MNFYVETFEYAKAKTLAEQILTTIEKTLGPPHDKTGDILVKLGEIYQATYENKKPVKALARYRSARHLNKLKLEKRHVCAILSIREIFRQLPIADVALC